MEDSDMDNTGGTEVIDLADDDDDKEEEKDKDKEISIKDNAKLTDKQILGQL